MSAQDSPVVALDAMGGDRAPGEPVRGAIAAAAEGQRVILVGDEATVREEVERQAGDQLAGIEVLHASELIDDEEDGARAVRAKPDSSLVTACRLVAEGRASGVVSAGHSGATLAAAILHVRRVPGVFRPGIAVVLPSAGGPVVLIDAGANADSRAEYLPQFALMGRLLCRDVIGVPEPRVGLLSIGEEPGKGSEMVQAAYEALEGSPGFVGNVEGRDIPKAVCDLVVTDGFTGNVVLKLYEGLSEMLFREVALAVSSSPVSRLGGLLVRPAVRGLRRRYDPEEYGGAYLLGVRGLVVISHGNASGRGIANALRLAARGAREGLVARLEAGLAGPREAAPKEDGIRSR